MSETYPANRFYVMIDGIAQAVFTEVSGLQIETETLEYAEGGNNGFVHRLPGRTRVGNVTLKRGITKNNDFFKWYVDIAAGRKIERRNISVVMFGPDASEIVRWNFLQAYPVRWVGPQFNAGSAEVAVESIEMAHAGIQIG